MAGCKQPQHLGALFEPARDLKPGAVMPIEPHRQRAQSAQAEINVVGADAQAAQPHVVLQVARPSGRWPKPFRSSRRRGRRYIWCRPGSRDRRRNQARGNRAGSPRYCPSAQSRPWHAPPSAMAVTSCISKLSEPGDSRNTARVFSRISAAIEAAGEGIEIGGGRRHIGSGSGRKNCASARTRYR